MKKLTVVLSGLAVVFLALAIISASFSVSRTVDAIEAIGKVSFDTGSKEKLDQAIEYYSTLDTSLGIRGRVHNADTLEAAKLEYVRLAIKTAEVEHGRKVAEGYTDEQVAASILAAREAVDIYCGEDACRGLENYASLVALEAQYNVSAAAAGAPVENGTDEAEEIELC